MAENRLVRRTINVTVCDCLVVDENNNMKEQTVELYGDYRDDKRAQNAVRRKLKNPRVLLKDYHIKRVYYAMRYDKFVENADIIREL